MTKAVDSISVTELLQSWEAGNLQARDQAFELLYPEFKRLARIRLSGNNCTLTPTQLVSEAYCIIARQRQLPTANREHFLATYSTLMRRACIDYLRSRRRIKRGAHLQAIDVEVSELPAISDTQSLVIASDLIEQLLAEDHHTGLIVDMKIFGGMEMAEIARHLGLSLSTVVRRWRFARAWLTAQLQEPAV